MNNKWIMAVMAPLLITLIVQAYLLVQLNHQLYHLVGQINQADSPQITLPMFSTLTPTRPDCGNDVFESRAETL